MAVLHLYMLLTHTFALDMKRRPKHINDQRTGNYKRSSTADGDLATGSGSARHNPPGATAMLDLPDNTLGSRGALSTEDSTEQAGGLQNMVKNAFGYLVGIEDFAAPEESDVAEDNSGLFKDDPILKSIYPPGRIIDAAQL
jgi:hypothetical protein